MHFEDVLNEHNIPIAPEGHHHVRADWIGFDCPYCSPGSNSFRMGFNINSKAINCWNCGPQQLTQTLIDILNIPYHDARTITDKLFRNHIRTIKEFKHTGKLILPKNIGSLLAAHRKYLKSRGFNPDRLITDWGIQGIGIASRYSWSIFIPITSQGKVVSFTTRKIANGRGFRYDSAKSEVEKIPHKHLLYGEEHCKHACIVHEGPTDAWATGPGAVATFGTAVTDAQFARLITYPKRIICFDSLPDAQTQARILCDRLEAFPGTTINVELESAKDAAKASKKEIRQLRKMLHE